MRGDQGSELRGSGQGVEGRGYRVSAVLQLGNTIKNKEGRRGRRGPKKK